METGPTILGLKFPEILGLSGIALGAVIVIIMVVRNGGLVGNEIEQLFIKTRKKYKIIYE